MIPKFRAWDKNAKKMISWRRLLNGHNLRNVFMRPEMCGLILMQSTGLTDKNGVEIFEGDILRISYQNGTESVEKYTKVIYSNGAFRTNWHGEYYQVLGSEVTIYSEIIGNIHENPELLEGE